ncbi:type VI secretion system contractile sheath domain-containing protein [Microbulbifer aggregans]|uniref:type VI secretion system contractile sheath domain-containing protein n=1 Tax=Microbulbifer aggregans TaxID=1769779 RepID=UPI001CFEF658|nr:type VI secretion system contractile sheath large subunit [Microbulbifer aggregans]
MTRPTMDTLATRFGALEQSESSQNQNRRTNLKVAILGDFSGRESRGICDPNSIGARPAYRVSKDNFSALFERLQVGLKLPVMEDILWLLEFDDLHPDYLYQKVPLFKQFIELEKRLLTPAEFSAAASEIQQWCPEFARTEHASSEVSAAQSMLDAVLTGAVYQDQYQSSPAGQIDRLIKDIVAPYIQQKADADQAMYLEAVTQAASEAMRKIMHHSDFRQLEASWRSLQLLLRRLDDHPALELHLVDISKQEILKDFAQAEGDLENSELFKCLVAREAVAGNGPFNLVIGDFYVTDEEQDLHLLIDLATIAEAAGSAVVLGGDNRLAGCSSLAGSLDPDDWYSPLSEAFSEGWTAVCGYSACEHVALAAPRFMLRLPFGAETARTDAFAFEELTPDLGHQYYLWGNSAYLLGLSICSAFIETGRPVPVATAQFHDFPLHVRNLPQGKWMTPCAEALLNDRAAACFQAVGISTLRSVQGRDEIYLPKLQSIAGTALRGPW